MRLATFPRGRRIGSKVVVSESCNFSNYGAQVPKQNYHQARKQRELARKARQQAKEQRRSARLKAPDESEAASTVEGSGAPVDTTFPNGS